MSSGLTVKGIPQLRARLEGLSRSREQLSRGWALKTTQLAKQNLRPHKKTGATSASIAPRNISEHGAEVKVGGAGLYIEEGTAAHDIRPRRAKALRFAVGGSSVTRLTGAPRKNAPRSAIVFAKKVRHPGTKADPFLMPAAREALGDLGVKVLIDGWNSAA